MNNSREKTAFKFNIIGLYFIGIGCGLLYFIQKRFSPALCILVILGTFTLLYNLLKNKLSTEKKASMIFISMFLCVFISNLILKSLNVCIIYLCGICVATLLFFNPKISGLLIIVTDASLLISLFFFKFVYESGLSFSVVLQDMIIFFIVTFFIYFISKFGYNLLKDNEDSINKTKDLLKQVEEKIKISDELLNNQKKVAENVKNISAKVETSANSMNSMVDNLSSGCSTQSSAVEELTSTIEIVKGNAVSNADKANELKKISQQTSDNVMETTNEMNSMIKAMDDIKTVSSQINNIVNNIDSIAFQTNILALNASVEAARAGSAGKGFAVVATEVRTLAQKSAEATKDTEKLIKETIKAIKVGTDTLDSTAKSLNKIISDTELSEKYVQEILLSSKEQNASIEQILVGIKQISDVVQENVATSEESAASSHVLLDQSKELNSAINSLN